ncbi:hypothetical protein [Acidithiobacillus caldus]|uniref:hypothetical protein n=1 Tax=Acidithiobacillus caldus TaxID=33059 RepID=UPI000872B54B|nr:hypothetical protein [Acidithiobacillus caldus]OFC35533.1 hypothetical protein BAE29_15380 [Acidithiobacillus caldus]
MSVTVTCKRLASAFRAGDKIIYLLHEVTYESNLYPHTKHLSTIAMGELPEVMKAIFEAASYVEGGAVNSPDRKMTPERYIKSWINALKKPYRLSGGAEQTLKLQPMFHWNEERLKALQAGIEQRGTAPTLINHYDLVASTRAFPAVHTSFSDSGQPLGVEIDETLGYKPVKCSNALHLKQSAYLHLPFSRGEYYVALDEQGHSAGSANWLYRIMGEYIRSIWRIELLFHPGLYKDLISGLRDKLEAQPVAQPKDVLCFLEPLADDHYAKERVFGLMEKYGREFRLSEVEDEDSYHLYNLAKRFRYTGASTYIVDPSNRYATPSINTTAHF